MKKPVMGMDFATDASMATRGRSRKGRRSGGGRSGRRYGAKAQSKVRRAMHERKQGTLRSGRSGKRVTSRKQAIAIGLSEARRAGGKVPRQGSRKRSKRGGGGGRSRGRGRSASA